MYINLKSIFLKLQIISVDVSNKNNNKGSPSSLGVPSEIIFFGGNQQTLLDANFQDVKIACAHI